MQDDMNVSQMYEEFRSEYRAAKQTRFQSRISGIKHSGSGADYHYRSEWEYLYMMERARHFERNDMVVGQGIRRLVSNIVQDGFTADPQTGDADLDKALKDAWTQWANDPDQCHSEGELTFSQIERLMLRSTVRDGDVFALLTDEGTIQPVEAHRPRTPSRTTRNVVHGILLDERARRKEVWITKEDVSIYSNVSKVGDIQATPMRDQTGERVVLQVYFPDRFSQRRGVTVLAPPSEVIGMHDDLQFTTMVKAQMASLVVLIREQQAQQQAANGGPPIGNLGGSALTGVPGSITQIPGIAAGIDYLAPAGQTLKGFTPNIPNAEFFPHTMLLLTFIAINLDMPVQMLLLDPQKSNFSSWRGAIDQARMRFREIQGDYSGQLHDPTWKWKTRQFASQSLALRRMIGNNPKWQRCLFNKPAFAYIDPLKDAQADALQNDKFLSSPRRLHAARNQDWDDIHLEIVEDRVKLLRAALLAAQQLTIEFNTPITFRDVLSPDFGAATQSAQQRSDEEADDEEQETETETDPKKSPSRKVAAKR